MVESRQDIHPSSLFRNGESARIEVVIEKTPEVGPKLRERTKQMLPGDPCSSRVRITHVHHIIKDVSNLIGRPEMLTDHGLWATRIRRGATSVVQTTASKEGDLFLKSNAKRPVIMLRGHSLQVGCNPALRARGGGRKCNGLGAIKYYAPNIT